MGVWVCAWRAVSLLHPLPSVESTCSPTSVTTEGPSRKEEFSDSQAQGRAEKGNWNLELMLFSEEWECLVPAGLMKTLHLWVPLMGCDMK